MICIAYTQNRGQIDRKLRKPALIVSDTLAGDGSVAPVDLDKRHMDAQPWLRPAGVVENCAICPASKGLSVLKLSAAISRPPAGAKRALEYHTSRGYPPGVALRLATAPERE